MSTPSITPLNFYVCLLLSHVAFHISNQSTLVLKIVVLFLTLFPIYIRTCIWNPKRRGRGIHLSLWTTVAPLVVLHVCDTRIVKFKRWYIVQNTPLDLSYVEVYRVVHVGHLTRPMFMLKYDVWCANLWCNQVIGHVLKCES